MTNESLPSKELTSAGGDQISTAGGTKIQPKKVGTGLTDLADTIAGRGMDDDEIASLIKNNWPKALLVLFVVVAGIWISDAVKTNRAKVATETVQKFADAQRYFTEVVALGDQKEGTPKTTNDPYRAMQDSFTTLKGSYSSSIYSRLADLYLAAADLSKRNFDSAKAKLAPFANSPLLAPRAAYTTGGLVTDEDFVNEMGALLYARTQLAAGETEAREKLLALMKSSKFVSAEAAVLYARTANTSEEKARAGVEVRALISARPEFNKKVLGPVMGDLGISLES